MVGVWRLVLVAAVLAVYFVAAAPFGYAAFALLHLFPSRDRVARAKMLQRVIRWGFTVLHDTARVLRLIDFDPRAVRGALPDGPCVLVANHPSLIDTTAILSSFADVTTAVKPRLYRRWWLRPLLDDAAQFEGASSGALGASRVIEAGMGRLEQGFRVLMFPEGTRSPAGSLHPFGRTAFEIACRAGVPVVPIVIRCEPRWLTKERGLLRPPARTPRVRLKVLSSVDPSGDEWASRRLRDVIYERVREELVEEK